MARYIDAEKLLKDMRDANTTIVTSAYIEAMPSADVREVRHGKWVTTETSHEWIDDVCSECGYVKSLTMRHKYCPNCGAQMEE